MHPALAITDLRKSFGGTEVLKGISFSIEPGEVFGLLGPNGAGKSTTINMISGVTKIESGKISIFGFDVKEQYRQSRQITGVMHQENVLDISFSIEQALPLHSGYYGVFLDEDWKDLLLDRLALKPHIKKRTNMLSGGMRRRYMVAKALIHKPKFLILDEPTAGVDIDLRRSLWDFIREINQQGTTVLLTTHYLEEAEAICSRIAIMDKGNIKALEKKEDLLKIAGEKKLFVHLTRPQPVVPPILHNCSVEVLFGGATYLFRINQNFSTGRVLALLQEARLEVRDLETAGGSLEDVFLKITHS